jgi:hypothetical protein
MMSNDDNMNMSGNDKIYIGDIEIGQVPMQLCFSISGTNS